VQRVSWRGAGRGVPAPLKLGDLAVRRVDNQAALPSRGDVNGDGVVDIHRCATGSAVCRWAMGDDASDAPRATFVARACVARPRATSLVAGLSMPDWPEGARRAINISIGPIAGTHRAAVCATRDGDGSVARGGRIGV
jgi:hypothetical protein